MPRHLLFTIFVILFLIPTPAHAQGGIIAERDRAMFNFPDQVTFSVDLQSDADITVVTLEYGVEQLTCGEVTAKAFPQFEPAKSVQAEWIWEMKKSGSLPPGATIWWRWHVVDSSGNELRTDLQTITWLDSTHVWQTQEGGNIALHWYDGSADFGARLHTAAVEALAALERNAGLKPDDAIHLYIYADTTDMREAILYEPGWTGGMAFPANNIVIIGIAPADIDWGISTEAHELTHVLVGHLTFSCLGFIPTWLNEGLAVYGEGGMTADEQANFDQAVAEDSLASVRALSGNFSENPSRADLSYSQSYSLVDYLIESFGQAKLNALLLALRDGSELDAALQAIYGFDVDGLEDAWRQAIGAQPRRAEGSPATPTAAPTPVPTIIPVSNAPQGPAISPTRDRPAPTAVGQSPANAPSSGGPNCLGAGMIIAAVVGLAGRKKRWALPVGLMLLVVFTVASACALSGASTPAPAVTPQAGGNYPPLPTATAYQSPKPPAGVFADSERGLTVDYPEGWSTAPSEDNPDVLTYLFGPNQAVIALVFVSPFPSGETLESFAADLSQGVLTGLANIEITRDEAFNLKDGDPAWLTEATGTRTEDNASLKIGLYTTVLGGRAFSLLVFGDPADYDASQGDIDALAASLHAETPSLYGIPRQQALVFSGGESSNPREYDPATTHGSGDKMVFSSLVSFDPQMNLTPDLAATWEIQDGVIYTFELRADARFHNGRPVTAQDVIYSWERAAAPETESDTVLTYLGDIVGVRERRAGQADHISGLKAIDDHTLQVTIDAPKPYFLLKLTYPTAFVLDRQNVESGSEWYRTPNGAGPYRLARWDSFKVMIYERNMDYYLEPPAIPYVVVQLYSGIPIRLYESGEIDIAGVSNYDVARVLSPDDPLHTEVRSSVALCTSYIVFDVNQPPFDDPKVRQAFSMAFDRQKYIDVVLQGIDLPASGLFPPGLPGYNPDLQGLPYDPEQARQLLSESKYGGSQGLPPIVYTSGGLGSDIGSDVSAVAQMWQQTLGVTIQVENLEPDRFMDELHAGRHGQLFGSGWCADYPDPENFADALFHTGAQQNLGNYTNPQVDALLEQARIEQDVAKRIQLYQQVEQMIVADAPVIFTVHGLSYVLVKPHIQGYVITPVDVPLERYLWIDPEKLK
jgi:oligopeptide transport system substrate-binding protein